MMTDAPQGTKCCTKCGETKPLDAFGKYVRSPDGYKPSCKACRKADYQANRDSALGKQKEYYARNAEARKAYGRAWYAENRDYRAEYDRTYSKRYNAENRAKVAERRAAYKRANPDVVARSNHARRAVKLGVQRESYSRKAIFAAYGNTCAYCDAPAEHLDHVIALSLGGADAAHNLLPACAPCNLGKGAKTLAEWAATFGA
jgi:5-methylcytosine-specific restriction endonuclease McrA